MGLLRWLRGGDDNTTSGGGFSLGMAEMEAVFNPGKRHQTELVEDQKHSQVDLQDGENFGDDELTGLLVGEPFSDEPDDGLSRMDFDDASLPVEGPDVPGDGLGHELDGDGGQQQSRDAGEHLDPAALDKAHDH